MLIVGAGFKPAHWRVPFDRLRARPRNPQAHCEKRQRHGNLNSSDMTQVEIATLLSQWPERELSYELDEAVW